MKLDRNKIIYGIGALGLAGFGAMQISNLNNNADIHDAETIKQNNIATDNVANKNIIAPDGNFDFYVLSLTWSPTYCLTSGDNNNQQCNNNHGFIVHGLWPQFEKGYPRECPTKFNNPDNKTIKSMMDIMPSDRLVKIQWERHGTCTGLEPNQYFQTLRQAYNHIKIPDLNKKSTNAGEIETAFINANNGLAHNMIAITTKEGKISDVRICMTKELQFRACDEVNRNAARENYRLSIPEQ